MSVLRIGPLWRSVEGRNVKRANQMQMYRLGVLHQLKAISSISDDGYRDRLLRVAKINLMQFVEDPLNSEVVPGAINRAEGLLYEIDNYINNRESSTMNLSLTRFETSLDDDLSRLPTYLIERVGAYSVDQLISSADNVFPRKIKAKLPKQIIDDFRSAGACLVYEQPTACGFHVYRAVDGVLRTYCDHFGATPKGSGRDWGGFIRALRDAQNSADSNRKPNVRTVELLDSIRAIDRNPLVHQELNLDSDDALSAFDLCKNAVSLMIADIISSP